MKRAKLLLFVAFLGLASGLFTAMGLMPRVRLVEVVTLFFSAFGAGATLVGAIIELRKAHHLDPRLASAGVERGRPAGKPAGK